MVLVDSILFSYPTLEIHSLNMFFILINCKQNQTFLLNLLTSIYWNVQYLKQIPRKILRELSRSSLNIRFHFIGFLKSKLEIWSWNLKFFYWNILPLPISGTGELNTYEKIVIGTGAGCLGLLILGLLFICCCSYIHNQHLKRR